MTWRDRRDQIEILLSSRRAVATAVVVAFIALFLAIYVEVRQINLTGCLADYNDATARRTAIITAISAEERRLDRADADAEALVEHARQLDDAAERATLLSVANQERAAMRAAFTRWLAASSDLAAAQESARKLKVANAKAREHHEEQRRRNPVPPPPSQRCG